MKDPRKFQWAVNMAMARAILRDRASRRKFLTNCAFVMLGVFAIGLLANLDGWLMRHAWLAVLWLLCCLASVLFVIGLAVYDMGRVIREERDKRN